MAEGSARRVLRIAGEYLGLVEQRGRAGTDRPLGFVIVLAVGVVLATSVVRHEAPWSVVLRGDTIVVVVASAAVFCGLTAWRMRRRGGRRR